MHAWEKILEIVYRELGESVGKVFMDFYNGFPINEQYTGAVELLSKTLGPEAAKELLKDVI
ncbi:MAG: hypothetical protein HYV90_00705 [Candidatus Woesebacteria bacterium]|nr:MAG: hypothetical protein HYV90_00705 [Candidatus Woesebacteria bacterium]